MKNTSPTLRKGFGEGEAVEFLDLATLQPIYQRLTADIPKPRADASRHEADIILAFHRHKGNVSAMERDLREKGIEYSRSIRTTRTENPNGKE
ncbi:MAG: hypothetical protein GY866_37565 [Proteobacteria bacterium]|nr:hypothetical protein [Pseudomonadota bacterium]